MYTRFLNITFHKGEVVNIFFMNQCRCDTQGNEVIIWYNFQFPTGISPHVSKIEKNYLNTGLQFTDYFLYLQFRT